MQREEEVGARRVGGLGARVDAHALVLVPREPHAAALGAQQLSQTQAESQRVVLLPEAAGADHAVVGAPVAGVDDHGLSGERPGGHEPLVALGDLLALATALRLAYRVQHRQGGLADYSVWLQAGVALELFDRVVDGLVEDASLRPGVEAEQVEFDLQAEHVVAAEGGHAKVQKALADFVAGLHQLAPGVGLHAAVDDEAAALLEGA